MPNSINAARHSPVPLRLLLGLSESPDEALWSRVRATQLFAGRRLVLLLLAANLLGATVVAQLFVDAVPLRWLIGWCVAVTIVSVVVTVRRLRTEQFQEGVATLNDLHVTAIEGLALAGTWSVAPLIFANGADAATQLALWTVLCVLMTAAAVAMAPLLLAALSLIGGLAIAVALSLAMNHAYLPAVATLLFAGLLLANCITRARTLVMWRRSELTLSDRDETVSLLLGEHEDSASDWLWECDAQRRLCKVTPRFAAALGRTPEQLENMPLLQALAGPTWEAGTFSSGLRQLAERLKRRESIRHLSLPVFVGEEQRWWEMSASPRTDERGTFIGFRGVGSDVTEQRASTDKINRMARFDALTGLPNRLLVNEALAAALAEAEKWGRRAAFMMIDLDRFKAVNDTLGHPIGDRLLGRVSERLAQLISDTELIGRLGGDEFAVVVNDATDSARVRQLAQTIIDTLSKPYEVDEHTLYIGASVGVACSPRDGRTAETLIRSADLALYRSKDAGGGVFHAYEPQLHVEAEERRVLEIALRKALDRGELHLEYQPVVSAADERLTGFEALLRWRSAEFGPVSPIKFIPLAEEARLIGPIGAWVVRTACEEAARWPGDTRIAVNVSPEQLHNPEFVTIVAQALATSRLPAHRLELEVTEGVFMKEGTCAVRVLERILDLGVRLSLDDFGTGYSSLGYLSRTRFSSIKIDRSFVQAASKGVPEATAIIRAVVALAGSLGMATTAEGVETADELAMIRDLGCSKIQGYYYGRPLPVAEARAVATRAKPNVRAA
ncbi:putative bifunctional diguanylate cyclase/phosphodiesterase [Sphingomonas radiodurans]|uniref:putative bifunctional diguanylate cyclase/phosphodiesterase n=1 Tax=Sphingomonas radiodurans TaxID=2890321 RepID=UPI001E2C3682|nr:GGDEF and EAL domain-containing protein [Sphingomonas radiodurans]WBH17636.1 EAL domain-containing protein [Sphingomonas radiodurans]